MSNENREHYKIDAEKIIHDVLTLQIRESTRKRRWKIALRLILLSVVVGYLVFFAYLNNQANETQERLMGSEHVGVVELKGTIVNDKRSLASADKVINALGKAFAAKGSKAVIIEINSPGGSPVQSAQIYREIERLKQKHPEKKVYAVAEDLAASGAYYVAAAADEIYADANSMVGSIGVIMGGFGFTELMDKAGVERRVYTAGNNKALMDPFSEVNPSTIPHLKGMLDGIHSNFIEAVKQGRKDRLKGPEAELFSGLVWTGDQALELGLVDGLQSTRELARDVIGVDRLVTYSPDRTAMELLLERIAVQASAAVGWLFSMENGSMPQTLYRS